MIFISINIRTIKGSTNQLIRLKTFVRDALASGDHLVAVLFGLVFIHGKRVFLKGQFYPLLCLIGSITIQSDSMGKCQSQKLL